MRFEAFILEMFNHPNIIKFADSHLVSKKKEHSKLLYLYMEYADGGDLADIIKT